jgi:AraC-like DNA-binding protein
MALSILHSGSIRCAFGAESLSLRAGQIVLFWGAVPRRVIEGSAAETQVQIPLGRYLSWQMPEASTSRLLSGGPLFGLKGDTDEIAAARWEDDLASQDPYLARAAEHEIQACVLRMARSAPTPSTPHRSDDEPLEELIRWILASLHEPFTIAQASEAAGLPPSAAMKSFRRRTGQTIVSFVTHHRLARAKHLLLSTSHPVGMIALSCGFGSERRFFEAFRSSCGLSPGQFRRQMRAAGD